jgi:hypothetical protein
MGAPRYNIPWSSGEERAFGLFQTANDLAEALDGGSLQHDAWAAMSAIPHLALPLRNWITLDDLHRRKNIVWIGIQETLNDDFKRLCAALGLPAHVQLPTDLVAAHRAPEALEPISERARANIMAWYAEDVAIYDYARQLALTL